MSSIEELYPVECAFCKIAQAYPANDPSSSSSPVPHAPDPEKVFPQCQLLLSTPLVLAVLDIMPIAPGHILLITREHYKKLTDMYPSKAPTLGEWMPILSAALCKATGIEDWNVVQNNGERAAQVVPHVHFHFIPRYQEGRREVARKGNVDMGMLRSWKMFGRGAREELDEDEGAELARVLREALREVLGEEMREGGKSKL
ncbi:HIT-like domain-containing protein [Neohortaea acidophila]|uniref:HIT-like domain-containing protein n=1 Tax=Neohortaea acidophila TaxID=245834 RepID=A0A6A6Q492_9PEZI|nr:HIT-like domain-containing protein [Neohortaea acidophila]KAF2486776.1 HIT-like domain-containing protein [Neohortaea acidophila]